MRRIASAALVLIALTGCGTSAGHRAASWPRPNLDLASTRSLPASGIDRGNVKQLRVAWRFRIPTAPGPSGALTATPVVAGGTVYLQDMQSDVYALDLATGTLKWRRRFGDANPGPNGVAAAGGHVYGATDAGAFALDARTGKVLWQTLLATATARYVDMAPQIANGRVYVSTVGVPPDGKGVLYALDARTGAIRWRFTTIAQPWRIPALSGGGGAWYTPSVAGGQVFWGTTNPYPYGGSGAHPNGSAYGGAALYTDSLVVTRASDGHLDWYDQVTPHDVRDYDFPLPPVLIEAAGREAVVGAGKSGLVVAWDRTTHRRLWTAPVGVHRNDRGPLPAQPVSVCPGLLGGVETPIAAAGGRLFVPVVDLCMRGSATGYENLDAVNVAARGRGELVSLDAATGRAVWTLRLPQPDFGCATAADGVVFTATFDGSVYGVDTQNGHVLWRAKAGAGVNSCPALAANTLLVGAGVPLGAHPAIALTAYRVGT
ncbi:MAG TPA: PQQ-binding-like beta-propeller repeat protein [Gaiellaceae bacterium]|nr:PQQ-binding-like beta-propeller repeat protein [Gaiellaceae bacterium]